MTTSYTNLYGSGDRTSLITVTTNISFVGSISLILDGNRTNNGLYFTNGIDLANKYIKFVFPTSILIDGFTWFQSDASYEGTWSFNGSNDDVNWTNITGTFALSTSATSEHSFNNTKWYKIYKLIGVVAQSNQVPWIQEIEFKTQTTRNSFLINSRRNRFAIGL